MGAILTSIISLAGALLGVVVGAGLTQRYQRRNTQMARLHEDRITAYSEFIGAIVEYRRTHVALALDGSPDHPGDSLTAALKARSGMWAAYYRVKLLAADDRTVDSATEVHALARRLRGPGSADEIRERSKACIAGLNAFTVSARQDVMSGPYADDINRFTTRSR